MRLIGFAVRWGLEEFLKREMHNSVLPDHAIQRLRRGEAALKAQNELRSLLIGAASLTAAAIAVAIIALPCVPMLARSFLSSAVVTIGTVALTLACLLIYGRVALWVIRRA